MKSDDSCISNPEIQSLRLDFVAQFNLRFRISGFEMQESSDFKISRLVFVVHTLPLHQKPLGDLDAPLDLFPDGVEVPI